MPLALIRQSSFMGSLDEVLHIGPHGFLSLTDLTQKEGRQQGQEEMGDGTQRKKQGSDPRPEPYQECEQKLNG